MALVSYTIKCSTCNRTINGNKLTVPSKVGDDLLICNRCYNRMPIIVRRNICYNVGHNDGHEYNKDMITAYKNSNPSYIYNKGYVVFVSINGKRQFKKFNDTPPALDFLKNSRDVCLINVFDNRKFS